MRALLAGDAAPLHRLYGEGTDVTLERLSAVWKERLAAFAERHGAARGAEVLGTARREDRHFTVVRFRFERGVEDVAFVWQGEPQGRLLGISIGGLEPRLRFRGEAAGGYAAWDPRSGATVPLRVEGAGAAARLLIGGGDQAAAASRRPGAIKNAPGEGSPGAREVRTSGLSLPTFSVQAPRPRVPATSTWCTAS